MILLWQAYSNKDTVLNPTFELYDEINISLLTPFNMVNLQKSNNSSNTEDSILSTISEIFKTEPERKEQCIVTFYRLNQIRSENGRKKIEWDERAYNLAIARAKDMYERNYFDHVTPEGECTDDFKKDYGFSNSEFLPENIGSRILGRWIIC